MEEYLITCPNPSCGAPLRLPAQAVGQPLSCPHCASQLAVSLTPGASVAEVRLVRSSGRLPRSLIVPAFALLIVGGAGLFANLYVATEAWRRPAFAREFARDRVADLRGSEKLGPGGSPTSDATPFEAFAALAGAPAMVALQQEADAELAETWAPFVLPVHAAFAGISFLAVLAGICTYRGRGYWLALLGSMAAIININMMCCVPGAVAGLWGILTLVRDEGRKHFGIFPNQP